MKRSEGVCRTATDAAIASAHYLLDLDSAKGIVANEGECMLREQDKDKLTKGTRKQCAI
jgi:hypothetical protein